MSNPLEEIKNKELALDVRTKINTTIRRTDDITELEKDRVLYEFQSIQMPDGRTTLYGVEDPSVLPELVPGLVLNAKLIGENRPVSYIVYGDMDENDTSNHYKLKESARNADFDRYTVPPDMVGMMTQLLFDGTYFRVLSRYVKSYPRIPASSEAATDDCIAYIKAEPIAQFKEAYDVFSGNMNTSLTQITGDISTIKTSITNLQTLTNGHTSSINTNTTNIGTMNTAITNLQTLTNGHTSSIATNTSSIGTINTTLGTVNTSISNLQTTTNTHTTNIATNASNISTINSTITTMQAGMSSMVGRTAASITTGQWTEINSTFRAPISDAKITTSSLLFVSFASDSIELVREAEFISIEPASGACTLIMKRKPLGTINVTVTYVKSS